MEQVLAHSLASDYLAYMFTSDNRIPAPDWVVSPGLSPYPQTLAAMEAHVAGLIDGEAAEQIWLVEHPPVITAGTSAAAPDLVDAGRFPVVRAGRGGRYTYHGPGQRVVYPLLDLNRRGRDVRAYVEALERWAIAALGEFGVDAFLHEAGTGIWVRQGRGERVAKIGAIGVRVRKWVAFHGLAINVSTNLSHFDTIIPCGIAELGVARLVDFAPSATMADLDQVLRRHPPSMLTSLTARRTAGGGPLEAGEDCR